MAKKTARPEGLTKRERDRFVRAHRVAVRKFIEGLALPSNATNHDYLAVAEAVCEEANLVAAMFRVLTATPTVEQTTWLRRQLATLNTEEEGN
jgi:hypothetical protein